MQKAELGEKSSLDRSVHYLSSKSLEGGNASHSQGQRIRTPSGTDSGRWRKIKQERHPQTPGSLRSIEESAKMGPQAEDGESGKGE